MPEGPEIRRAADRLALAVVGKRLTDVFFAPPALKKFERQLAGQRIDAITSRGKALLTRFDDGWMLYSHNQLYGVWQIVDAGERPDNSRSLRVALETEDTAILLYSASDIAMWRTDDLWRHAYLSRLGPDVLDPALTADDVAARFHDPRFARRSLAALLLDQGFLAGMGNYLRSEVLFQSELRPERRPFDLDPDERGRLASALLEVPRRSYRSRGIRKTTGMKADYVTSTAAGFRMEAFGRAGEPCPRCGGMIVRRESGGRRLYLCESCQR
jgi:endonuclease-8